MSENKGLMCPTCGSNDPRTPWCGQPRQVPWPVPRPHPVHGSDCVPCWDIWHEGTDE